MELLGVNYFDSEEVELKKISLGASKGSGKEELEKSLGRDRRNLNNTGGGRGGRF